MRQRTAPQPGGCERRSELKEGGHHAPGHEPGMAIDGKPMIRRIRGALDGEVQRGEGILVPRADARISRRPPRFDALLYDSRGALQLARDYYQAEELQGRGQVNFDHERVFWQNHTEVSYPHMDLHTQKVYICLFSSCGAAVRHALGTSVSSC